MKSKINRQVVRTPHHAKAGVWRSTTPFKKPGPFWDRKIRPERTGCWFGSLFSQCCQQTNIVAPHAPERKEQTQQKMEEKWKRHHGYFTQHYSHTVEEEGVQGGTAGNWGVLAATWEVGALSPQNYNWFVWFTRTTVSHTLDPFCCLFYTLSAGDCIYYRVGYSKNNNKSKISNSLVFHWRAHSNFLCAGEGLETGSGQKEPTNNEIVGVWREPVTTETILQI